MATGDGEKVGPLTGTGPEALVKDNVTGELTADPRLFVIPT